MSFAAAGLLCYLLSLALFSYAEMPLLLIGSIMRLSPLILFRDERPRWPIVIATPYPSALILSAYDRRQSWLPEAFAAYTSTTTSLLVVTSGALLLSVVLTGLLIEKAALRGVTDYLRTLSILLFVITAVAVSLPTTQMGVQVMQYVAESVALAGYAAILGWGTLVPVTAEGAIA